MYIICVYSCKGSFFEIGSGWLVELLSNRSSDRLKTSFNHSIDWLIVLCLPPFPTAFQLYQGGQRTYPCFPEVLLTSSLHDIPSEPLAAFPHNHCPNNGLSWESNEICSNEYHQSSEKILAEPGDRTQLSKGIRQLAWYHASRRCVKPPLAISLLYIHLERCNYQCQAVML